MRLSPADRSGYGTEPVWSGVLESESALLRALNWYNYFHNHSDALDFLKEYAKKCENAELIRAVNAIPAWKVIPTYGWIAKMILRNLQFHPDLKNKFYAYLHGLIEEYKDVEPQETSSTKTESIKENARNIIADIEQALDEIYKTGSTEFKLAEYLAKNEIKPLYTNYIVEFYEPVYSELFDKDVAKTSKVTKETRKSVEKFLKSILQDCNTWKISNKKERKPRPVKIEKLVAKVKYQEKDNELGVSSAAPATLIKKDIAFVYDTKARKLKTLYAKGSEGFSIKGTTLQNVDEERSFEYTLRKPKEQLSDFIAQETKAKKLGFFTKLTTKKQSTTARLNETTLIIKAY